MESRLDSKAGRVDDQTVGLIKLKYRSQTWVMTDVPIEHHPTIRYMVYNGYYKVMSNLPKMGHLPTPVKGFWRIKSTLGQGPWKILLEILKNPVWKSSRFSGQASI